MDKISINGKPIENVTMLTEDNLNYTIVGLNAYNKENGNYELTIDLPLITAEDGSKGLVAQTYKWKVDLDIPRVKHFKPQFQGAVNDQNVTDMHITISKPIANEFEANWISLSKDKINVDASLIVNKLDDLHYLISGLGVHTQKAGVYKISIDQSKLVDEFGNYGVGKVDSTWVVSFERPLAPINVRITPDRGYSSTDNITSGNDLKIAFKTIQDKQTVALYAITPTSETLIQKLYVETAGEVSILINGYIGKYTFKVIAYDVFKNQSDAVSINAYIDITDLSATISIVKEEGIKLL